MDRRGLPNHCKILARLPHTSHPLYDARRIASAAPGAAGDGITAALAVEGLDANGDILWTEILKHEDTDSLF